jgi:PAS domain-containing protein
VVTAGSEVDDEAVAALLHSQPRRRRGGGRMLSIGSIVLCVDDLERQTEFWERQAYAWPMETRQKHLVLILARELASNLATPTVIADDEGRIVFFNEAAEEIVERTFAETGEVAADEWVAPFAPRTLDSEPVPFERLPSGIALYERRAAHERLRVTGVDDVEREVEVTAFPLFAHADEFVGVVTIFWRE